MMRPRLVLSLLLPMVAAVAGEFAPGVVHAEPGATELRVSAPVAAAIGDALKLRIVLIASDAAESVPGAPVTLYERTGFMGVSPREVMVASAVTGDDGAAVIRFTARREGVRNLVVRFDGDPDHGASFATFELPVAAGPAIYTVEPPPGIPGVNRFLVVGILVVVWGTMFIIAAHVIAIAREGHSEATPGGERS